MPQVLKLKDGVPQMVDLDTEFPSPATVEEFEASYLYQTVEAAEAALNTWLDTIRSQKTDEYPRAVRDLWEDEERMALAYAAHAADPNVPLPADYLADLDRMAADKNRTTADQVARILTNAAGLRALAKELRSLFQSTSTALRAALSPAEFEGIIDAAKLSAQPLETTFGVTV